MRKTFILLLNLITVAIQGQAPDVLVNFYTQEVDFDGEASTISTVEYTFPAHVSTYFYDSATNLIIADVHEVKENSNYKLKGKVYAVTHDDGSVSWTRTLHYAREYLRFHNGKLLLVSRLNNNNTMLDSRTGVER